MENIIEVNSFEQLYDWLEKNSAFQKYVWVNAKRGKPNGIDFSYIDAVYAALCFGWIDSTCKNIGGKTYQKLMPRNPKSKWSYLNIVRAKHLANKNLMTQSGKNAMNSISGKEGTSDEILLKIKKDEIAWKNFNNFPELYQKIRIDNIEWAKKDMKLYNSRLEKLISTAKENKMYGEWNDYGRLL